MAFYPYQYNLGDVPVMHLPASGNTVIPGMALELSQGELIKASGTKRPDFIALYDSVAISSKAGSIVPVEPVYPSTVYETVLSKNISGLKAGSICTIEASLSIGGISDGGIIKVLSADGDTKGSRVRFIFIEPAASAATTEA